MVDIVIATERAKSHTQSLDLSGGLLFCSLVCVAFDTDVFALPDVPNFTFPPARPAAARRRPFGVRTILAVLAAVEVLTEYSAPTGRDCNCSMVMSVAAVSATSGASVTDNSCVVSVAAIVLTSCSDTTALCDEHDESKRAVVTFVAISRSAVKAQITFFSWFIVLVFIQKICLLPTACV